jgi:hypothetical protein
MTRGGALRTTCNSPSERTAIYALYLGAFGFREVHSTTYGGAAAVVALPILLLILLVIFAAVFLSAAVFSSWQRMQGA